MESLSLVEPRHGRFDTSRDGPANFGSAVGGGSARAERLLRRCPLFGKLPTPLVAQLAAGAVTRSVPRNGVLWRAGAQATRFALVTSGLMKLTAPTGARGTILDVFGPGELMGLAASLEEGEYLADCVAVSGHAEVLLVPIAPALVAMRSHIETAIALNRCLCDFVRTLRRKIGVMSAGTVPQRLATLLLDLDARFGDVSCDEAEVVPVVLTRHELSLLVDAAVETTIRAMRRLEKDGVLETTGAGFVLHDRAALEAIARGRAA